jgi:predicted nucleic acid-binding protein
LNAVDTSVVVAAFSSWHIHHDRARAAMRDQPHLPSHAAAEAYSVLTRLPTPYRSSPQLVHAYLVRAFGDRTLPIGDASIVALLGELAALGIAGGAAYDGLIAITARIHDATLITLDGRASETYHRLGVRATLL